MTGKKQMTGKKKERRGQERVGCIMEQNYDLPTCWVPLSCHCKPEKSQRRMKTCEQSL